jgi:multicomponent Na+:H+ antiporter subunit B
VVRLLAPFIAMFALASLYRGHVTPGGGFQSAAIAGALMIALGLVFGREHAARLVPYGARAWLQAVGPLTFAVVALLGWRLTGAFLGYPAEEAAHAVREAMVVASRSRSRSAARWCSRSCSWPWT